jgi:hypothetical protein
VAFSRSTRHCLRRDAISHVKTLPSNNLHFSVYDAVSREGYDRFQSEVDFCQVTFPAWYPFGPKGTLMLATVINNRTGHVKMYVYKLYFHLFIYIPMQNTVIIKKVYCFNCVGFRNNLSEVRLLALLERIVHMASN